MPSGLGSCSSLRLTPCLVTLAWQDFPGHAVMPHISLSCDACSLEFPSAPCFSASSSSSAVLTLGIFARKLYLSALLVLRQSHVPPSQVCFYCCLCLTQHIVSNGQTQPVSLHSPPCLPISTSHSLHPLPSTLFLHPPLTAR